MKSETRSTFLPPSLSGNVLVDEFPARTLRNCRNMLALLSRINLNAEGSSPSAALGHQLLLQSLDQALEHAEACLIHQKLTQEVRL